MARTDKTGSDGLHWDDLAVDVSLTGLMADVLAPGPGRRRERPGTLEG